MTRSTSFLRSRFIAKTLVVGGLASCPLLLNADITLSQSYRNYREMNCTAEGAPTPYVFALTSWSGQPANSYATVQVTLNRYRGIREGFVPIAPIETDIRYGRFNVASAVAYSPVGNGFFRGDSYQESSFFGPPISLSGYRTCIQ